jgi:hypothetical protein
MALAIERPRPQIDLSVAPFEAVVDDVPHQHAEGIVGCGECVAAHA